MAMSPRLLRPLASGVHPEAADWRARVIANGGTQPTAATLRAVSQFCRAIDAAGIRSKFWRMNLIAGNELASALVPLYRAESRTASVRGNSTDANPGAGPFIDANFNNTGASSGLKANGTSTYLDTGLLANSLTASNAHFGIGLRATETRGIAFRTAIGAFNGSANAFVLDLHSQSASASAAFTRAGTASDRFGDTIGGASGPLAVGDIVAAWPTMYRNGAATGATATTSQDYPSAHRIYVFAVNNQNSVTAISLVDARISWYSIGLTMTASEALAFYNAIAAFNTALSRT